MPDHKKHSHKKSPDKNAAQDKEAEEKEAREKEARDKKIKDKIDFYEKLLKNSNIQAFLLTIRNGEGTLGEGGYHQHFGGGKLATLDVNPQMGITWTKGKKHRMTSSSVGAYQFQNKEEGQDWPEIVAHLHFKDISKIHQDLGALYIIDNKHAIPDILNGDIVDAINKTHGKWVSLPGGSQENQTEDVALKFYVEHGGNLNGPGRTIENNLLLSYGFPKFTENTFRHNMGFGRGKNLIAVEPGSNAGGKTDVSSIFSSGMLISSKKMQEWLAMLKMLESRTMGTLPGTKGSTYNLNDSNEKNKTEPIIDIIPALHPLIKKTSAVQQLMDNPFSVSLATPIAEAGKLTATFDAVLGPASLVKGNEMAGLYERYSLPLLFDNNVSRREEVKPGNTKGAIDTNKNQLENMYGISPAMDTIFRAGRLNKNRVNGNDGSANGRVININLNKPMIEHFTISVKDAKEGIKDLKEKVEEVLLEVLNSANVI